MYTSGEICLSVIFSPEGMFCYCSYLARQTQSLFPLWVSFLLEGLYLPFLFNFALYNLLESDILYVFTCFSLSSYTHSSFLKTKLLACHPLLGQIAQHIVNRKASSDMRSHVTKVARTVCRLTGLHILHVPFT